MVYGMVYGIRYTVRYTGIRYTGIRYTVICPFLQKKKVLRIAQPGRQNLNQVRPSILQPLIRPLLPYRSKVKS